VLSLRWLSLCAFALSLAPSFALADEPTLAASVQHRIEDGLLKPLVAAEHATSRFSRARLPPQERRVRVLQTTATLDKAGRPFVPFAIDVRFGSEWHENDIVGCAYTTTGSLFVKRGDSYRPAAFLFGQNVQAVAGVCEAAPAKTAGQS
jgi:hypothetical protein